MTPKVLKEARQLALDELLRAPSTAPQTLAIDEAFPEKLANQLAQQETFNKHLFRPNTYLHKWWARRCGSTFRAILKQFVSDPERRDYYAPGGLEGKVVLDPMMGGGTTLHEALRLGANVIGADIEPIPIVQARASLSPASLDELQAAFDEFFQALYEQVGRFFQTECPTCAQPLDSQYTLHGLRKHCRCGEVVQVDQYELRQEAKRTLRLSPETWEILEDGQAPTGAPKSIRLITKAETVCPVCHQKYQERLDLPFYERYTPLAVVGDCSEHGIFFKSPSETDWQRLHEANALRATLDWGPIEHFEIHNGVKSGDLVARHVTSYLDVFSSRQLLYLYHALKLIRNYQGVIKLNLAMLLSTALEFNAMLCGYKGWFKRRPGAIRHVFALHAYVFQYTVTENNPLNREKSSGNLQLLFRDRIVRGRKWAQTPVERKINHRGETQVMPIQGEWDGGQEVSTLKALNTPHQSFWLIHGDSRCLPIPDGSVDFVVTDPPYYDNVQYSDLAAFFRVWLAHMVPEEVDWAYDASHSAVAPKAIENDTQFLTTLSGIFQECGRVLKRKTGRLVFTFHHWDPNAWAELTIALQRAKFKLMNAYVVFSEHPISVHINNINSIKHDVILVLALSAKSADKRWPALERIETGDSENFCRECGATLGWLIESKFSPMHIRATWKTLIQGGN